MSNAPCPKPAPGPPSSTVTADPDSRPRRTWPARARRVRPAALEPLARRLGYRIDPRNRRRWRREGSVLAIKGSRFFDHLQGRGGGGAIDLVLHVRGGSFRDAVRFLERGGPALSALPPPQPSPIPVLRLPPARPEHWPLVRGWLTRTRRLAPPLLESCRRHRILYADNRRNAVFLCRDSRGRPTGAELRGALPGSRRNRFRGLAPGSRKARGAFWLPAGPFRPQALLLVESALDALSAHLLLPLHPHCLIVSTAGVSPVLPHWLLPFRRLPLLCGYDADPAGDRAAAALQRQLPHLLRLRPHPRKDWNDLLPPTARSS